MLYHTDVVWQMSSTKRWHADYLPECAWDGVDDGGSPEVSEDSAARRVERELRKAIITLEFQPGASLSEKDLADRYGTSRQPVREALINLGQAGLVEILPRRGTFVVKISLDQMRQARFIRESIEVAVVRRAAVTFDPSSASGSTIFSHARPMWLASTSITCSSARMRPSTMRSPRVQAFPRLGRRSRTSRRIWTASAI